MTVLRPLDIPLAYLPLILGIGLRHNISLIRIQCVNTTPRNACMSNSDWEMVLFALESNPLSKLAQLSFINHDVSVAGSPTPLLPNHQERFHRILRRNAYRLAHPALSSCSVFHNAEEYVSDADVATPTHIPSPVNPTARV